MTEVIQVQRSGGAVVAHGEDVRIRPVDRRCAHERNVVTGLSMKPIGMPLQDQRPVRSIQFVDRAYRAQSEHRALRGTHGGTHPSWRIESA